MIARDNIQAKAFQAYDALQEVIEGFDAITITFECRRSTQEHHF